MSTKKIIDQKAAWDHVYRRLNKRSLWMLHYCTGCGAVELPPTMTSRWDMSRFGVAPMVTPRQADILLITGYLAKKSLKRVILTYEQMQSPKWVVGFGSCAINGGMYWDSYSTIKQLSDYIPVDIYIAGCMPQPEAIIHSFNVLLDKINQGTANAWQDYYKNYKKYRENQVKVLGEFNTNVDIEKEAKYYGVVK
jgi:NADH-quinone oxidoreductase subunit B